ncbi:MAG: class B sortase [Clostridium sp.]|nr:class B sortase [Clostridium sp.]MEE0768409.1 class B sortase [Clostridia bacterium]
MYKKFYIFLIIMLVASLVTSISYIMINYKEDKKQNEVFEKLENIITESNEEKKEQKKETINFKKLYELNNDFVGWLKIENTNISYPVMQTENSRKNYYLRKNFYKEYSQLGTPYIAEYCNIQTSDNVIIYGHHIKNNQMFGELEKYKKKEFYKSHKIISFNTINEKANYEIVAVFKTVAYTGFEYYKFVNSSSRQEFDTFIQKCKELSFYETKNTAKYGDKLITLSTCEYSNKDGRLVVVAKKIKTELEE